MDPQVGESSNDFAQVPVPLEKRYSSLSMTLLWVTMVTGFPAVIVGFEWYKAGYSFYQVIVGALISSAILFVYALAASYSGAKTGLSFPLLCGKIFGSKSALLISTLQAVLFLLWYSLLAVFVATEIKGLLFQSYPLASIAFLAALLMAVNNLFGFAGIANFARYLAAPLLILWIIFLFGKCCVLLPHQQLSLSGPAPFMVALSGISSFVIGYAVWGNEADFWRYGKPRLAATAIPLLATIAVGQVICPLSGWMVAFLTKTDSIAASASVTTNFSFGAHQLLAAFVLTIAYFATGDSNLYGAINAIENVFPAGRRKLVLVSMLSTAAVAVLLSSCADAFQALANCNCILLPCVSIIIAAELFIVRKFWSEAGYLESSAAAASSSSSSSSGICQRYAFGSLVLAWMVGIVTSGVLPGTSRFHSGIWPLYSWLTGLCIYLWLRLRSRVPLCFSTLPTLTNQKR